MDEHPDLVLLRQAIAGDERALRRLYKRVQPLIRARVARAISNGHSIGSYGVDDMAQRVWIRLFEQDAHRLREFDPARGSLEGFVSTISEHAVIEEARLKRAQMVTEPLDVELKDPAPSPEIRAVDRDFLRRLRTYLQETMPIRGFLVYVLLYEDLRDEGEAAEIMGVSKQVVANWKHKIKTSAQEYRKKNP